MSHASNIKHYRITIVVFAFCDAFVTDSPSKLGLTFVQNVTILPDNNCGHCSIYIGRQQN